MYCMHLYRRSQLEQAGLRGSSPEAFPLKDAALAPSKMRLVAAVGAAAIGSGSGPAAVMELQASRQAGLRAREWPLQGLPLPVYGTCVERDSAELMTLQ